ncbi:aminopeptidase P family protein [Candidatus Aerophobetes bacterium]|nr:aminopeptidase P family protein [Candidatus Aerophobetes bacterium]
MQVRWEKLERNLKENKLDAFLLTSSVNIFYFSGLYIDGTVLFTPQKKFVFTSPMYEEEAKKGENEWEVIICRNSLEKKISKISGMTGVKTCGFEANRVSFAAYKKIKENLQLKLIACYNIVEKIRSVKDEKEIELIQKAEKITSNTFEYLKKILHPGITEKELAREGINYILKWADDISFPPIVLFGERTSLPHAHPANRELKENDLVLIDIGAKVKGYCADMTRTFLWNEPSGRWEKILTLVNDVKKKAISFIKPGVKSSEIDKVVREEFARAGYEKNFLHGTGHGVGLEVHEEPFLNRSCLTPLREGMVVTVEPGVYFTGEGGVRIEDMVLVTNRGGKILL